MISIRKSHISATVTGLALLGCAVAGMTLGTPKAAVAQAAADTNADKPISINMQNTPIQAVLKALFNSVGANYSIDADVQGNVNITMNNVGFLAALRSILHATNPPLTYDYTDGVYHIRVKKQDVSTTTAPTVPGDGGSTTSNPGDTTTVSSSDKRFYKLPIDHYDVIEMARFVADADQKIAEIVPASMGASGQRGSTGGGGGMGGGMGGGGMTGGMGMSGGMGGGMGMSSGMGGGGMGGGGYGGGRGF